jgi:hypothetical protein
MQNSEQCFRKVVMRPRVVGLPETTNPSFLGWAGESMWWARAAWRDAVRARWHAVMARRYELAVIDIADARPPEPPIPYPDE